MEGLDVHATKNLPSLLQGAAADGWQVVGAALGHRAVSPSELPAAPPTILVLGSEGAGLRTTVLRSCTQLVCIPRGAGGGGGGGEKGELDSLNVSVAGGILLYALIEARAALRRL